MKFSSLVAACDLNFTVQHSIRAKQEQSKMFLITLHLRVNKIDKMCYVILRITNIVNIKAGPIYWLANIIGRYQAVTDILLSAYGSPICTDIKIVFKAEKILGLVI